MTAAMLLGLAASPAAAAPAQPCTSINCYRYYADLSIVAWSSPSQLPVFPGSTHTYTVQVTNTGWRTGGTTGPVPGIGPDSGPVYVAFIPSAPTEYPVSTHYDFGTQFRCQGYYSNGLACDTTSLPSGTTSQFTVTFQAPFTPGWYTTTVRVDPFNWTDYNPNNNVLTLLYQVGYLA